MAIVDYRAKASEVLNGLSRWWRGSENQGRDDQARAEELVTENQNASEALLGFGRWWYGREILERADRAIELFEKLPKVQAAEARVQATEARVQAAEANLRDHIARGRVTVLAPVKTVREPEPEPEPEP